MAYTDRIAHTDSAPARNFASSANSILELIRRWWRARQAKRALSSFPDAMLKDIGIGRGEIGDAVRTGRPRVRRVHH